MSDFVPFPPPPPVESLALIGFRLNPASEGPQFYTLFAMEGENDRPLTRGGRILFFRSPAQSTRALSATDDETMRKLGPAPKELDALCDVAHALFLANSAAEDEDGLLLEAIACLDDLVRATRLNVPAEYMSVLSALSERLMQTSEFGTWMTEQGLDRERLEDAIMWCVGAVAVKASWIE